jgi:sugar transferase (PEP-CTERM/EpsH1 system associated)
MRILFLSMTVPYPPTDGGRIRVLNLLKQVAKTNEITFLALETTPTDYDGISYLSQQGIDARLVSYARHPPPLGLKAVANALVNRKPITVARYDFAPLRQAFEALLKEKSFDLIHYEMFHAAQYLVDARLPTLLSQQNVDSYIWRRLCEQTNNPLRKLLYETQRRAFFHYERAMSPKFDAVAVASEIDRELLEEIRPGLSIAVVPNGVDIELYQPNHALEEEASVIYTGSLDWRPNEDAVLYFADELFPLIQAKRPDVKFYVVGKSPTEPVRKLAERPGVIVTGAVEDIKPYIARATVYVVPLRIGSGTRLKILEALGMEKAIVSTTIGEEGLNLVDGQEIIIADAPTRFAEAVLQLLSDRQMRRRIGRQGRRRAEADYDWRRIGKKLDAVYEELAAQQKGSC